MTSAKTHVQTAREFHDLNMGFAVWARLSTNRKRLQTAMRIDIYARIVIFFFIFERFWGVPKQRKILANTLFFRCTCTRPGAFSRLLSVLGSTISCEAYEWVKVWGKLQWESMGTIIMGLCPKENIIFSCAPCFDTGMKLRSQEPVPSSYLSMISLMKP